MDANHVADLIVSSVKKSNLNFHIQESPFSLLINLRKTFIKNKNGNPLVPSADIFVNTSVVDSKVKIEVLGEEKSTIDDCPGKNDAELNKMKNALSELNSKLEKANTKIDEVQFAANKSANEAEKLDNENKTLKRRNDELQIQNETLRSDMNSVTKNLNFKENEIKRLENRNNILEEQLEKDRKNFEIQLKAFKKPAIKNKHKSTSTSTTSKIEFQTQTESQPAFSKLQSIDTLPIRSDFESSSSSLNITFNPTDPGPAPSISTSSNHCSSKCEHKPQCILREPRPPPSPTITFLYNERSKYHQHMMLWSKKEFEGHSRCFAVENENYGCDDCTWLKWWYKWHGENHGFPDIPEWIYKKYL